ncbi:MAG: hypothetical protein QM831_33830 [Kofleriaceae bacterium]
MRWLLLLCLIACKPSKSEPEDQPPAPQKYAVLPDEISGQLGEVGIVLAIDFQAAQLGKVETLWSQVPVCVNEIANRTKVIAITRGAHDWQGYVTGVPGPTLRGCIEGFGANFGATVSARGSDYEIDVGDVAAQVKTAGTLTTITEGSNAPHAGDAPAVITDLLARVPKTAHGLFVSSGFPDYKIKNVVAYLETDPATWKFTVFAEGSQVDMAMPWLESIVTTFKATLKTKGVVASDDWFKVEATPMAGKLVATVPISALGGAK